MGKILLHSLYIALVAAVLGISPLVFSGQANGNNLDVVVPEVKHVIVPSDVYSGSSITIKVKVADNVGIKSVVLYYRLSDFTEQYKKQSMKYKPAIDEYQLNIDDIAGANLDYYVEVMDISGNVVFHGSSFSPMSIAVQISLAPETIIGKKRRCAYRDGYNKIV